MTIMKIRGGDLDLVEYEFNAFCPGENLRTAGITPAKQPYPAGDTITARAPARIHLSVLDMNRFSPGTPGGGGLGFAIQIYCEKPSPATPAGSASQPVTTAANTSASAQPAQPQPQSSPP